MTIIKATGIKAIKGDRISSPFEVVEIIQEYKSDRNKSDQSSSPF
jgi:hypothetical protein